ncbi:MAG: hypothetical protein KAS23_01535, partial [Anaerohalosphaera sp.]|nr:hypothetical protein [Anaerohalosphaera sp.]
DPNDWTYDGVINYFEFAIFAAAWTSHDPNDPVCDPNSNDYNPNVFDPNHADYISSEQIAKWEPFYNFDATGDSQYAIDVADFAVFLDNWLWEACWHGNYSEVMYAMGGGESMMMSMESSILVEAQPVESVVDPDEVMKFLEVIADEMLEQKTIKKKDLIDFINAVEIYLYDNQP